MDQHPIRFVTLNPGHFHAALVHREMYPDVSPRVHIYAPVGNELVAHVQTLVAFNSRPSDPTAWELDVHAAPDYFERFRREMHQEFAR